MPWSARLESPTDGRSLKFTPTLAGNALPWRDVLHLWQTDPRFRAWFNDQLAAAPFKAFRWETPPVTRTRLDRPFECTIVDAPTLAHTADRTAFAPHFSPHTPVVAFPNLGNDAVMVVPCPLDPDLACYAHLAAFVRTAPADQRDALWTLVGDRVEQRLSDRPVWLSTAGAGVAWLHVRLDDRPKYYATGGYRRG